MIVYYNTRHYEVKKRVGYCALWRYVWYKEMPFGEGNQLGKYHFCDSSLFMRFAVLPAENVSFFHLGDRKAEPCPWIDVGFPSFGRIGGIQLTVIRFLSALMR